ncbi:MAG: hypothetical protein AAGA48_06305 [Myxococcota bacterium]
MRWVLIGLSTLVFAGCGSKYRPKGPVMSDYERTLNFPTYRSFAEQRYAGKDPKTQAPPLPFLAFGAAFDLDIALMPKSDDFDMIEVARLSRPSGPLWFALETNLEGDQTLVASIDDIDAILPELPLARRAVDRFNAEDASDAETIDLTLSYINSLGNRVDAKFEGDAPVQTERKRNGRAFDHSANQLLVALDIPAQESLFKADMKLDGADVSFRKIAGVVPGRFVQTQVQGGLAVGKFAIMPEGLGYGGPEYGEVIVEKVVTEDSAPVEVEVRPSEAVKVTVAQNFSTVQGCYLKRTEEVPELGGPLQVDFDISEGVVVGTALPEVEGGITDEVMTRCITRAVDGWTFADNVTGKVQWTFSFTPAEGDGEASASLGEGIYDLKEDVAEAAEADLDELDDFEMDESEDLPEAEEGEVEGEDEPATAEMDMNQGLRPEFALKNFTTVHTRPSGDTVKLKWLVTRRGNEVEAVQATPDRTLTYTYRLVSDAYLELMNIRVEQYGRGTPVTAVSFNPPLPDFRWESFGGKRVSDFVIDVNGQQNYMVGQVETAPGTTGPRLLVRPSAPSWAEDRPLLTTILYPGDGTANVITERVEL